MWHWVMFTFLSNSLQRYNILSNWPNNILFFSRIKYWVYLLFLKSNAKIQQISDMANVLYAFCRETSQASLLKTPILIATFIFPSEFRTISCICAIFVVSLQRFSEGHSLYERQITYWNSVYWRFGARFVNFPKQFTSRRGTKHNIDAV